MALGSLALAIGATTGVFSVVNALLLRELPYHEPDRIVDIYRGALGGFATPAKFRDDLAQSLDYLDDGALYMTNRLNVARQGSASRLRVTETSANFFSVLGVGMLRGRDFLPDEHEATKNQVAILSHRLWQQSFGGDPAALGSKLNVNGVPFTVVGIAPGTMDFPYQTDVWTATGLDLERIPKGTIVSQAIGRLKSGLTLQQARAVFETKVRQKDPKAFEGDPQNLPHLTPLRDELARFVRTESLILFATVALILLIACANVAQLLLARLNERRRELSIRFALGASRARITQQLVTEAMVLTLIAVTAGMAVAYGTARLVERAQPANLAVQAYTILDGRVLGFAVGVALLCGVLFGVLPAIRTGSASDTARVRRVLLAVQAALTVVLLAGSVSLGRTFLKLLDTNLGFDTTQLLTLQVSVDGTKHSGGAQFYTDVNERLRAIPGVEASGAALYLPLEPYPYVMASNITLENGTQSPLGRQNIIGEGFFGTLHQQFVAGRDFNDAERAGKELAVIVNEDLARSIGLGAGIVGQRLKGNKTVVGVVRSVRWEGPDFVPWNEWYSPLERSKASFAGFAIRVRGDAASYIAAVRAAVEAVDASVPIFRVEPMRSLLDERLAKPRFYTTAIAFLGAFALLLSAVGIYGVAANSVAQRTKEIGVRIAVGGSANGVRAMLLRQTMAPLVVGLAVGVTAALALGRYLQSLITSAEPVGAVVAGMAAVALIACCAVAVWRATAKVVRIDPMVALRVE
jgi:predicted permease